MPSIMWPAIVVLGYLWGSVSPAYLAARLVKGIDLRHYGSGTVSGTMVGIELGPRWKLTVTALDFLKGLIPPLLAMLGGFPLLAEVLAGLALICGHNWSLYLRGAGGRGLAASVGLMCIWDLRLAAIVAALLLAGPFSGLAGLMPVAAFALLAPAAWLLGDPPEIALGCLGLSAIIILKRLEANHFPLPDEPHAKLATIWRRVLLDRDVPLGQPWEEREKLD